LLFLTVTLAAVGCAGEREDVLSAHEAQRGEVRVFNVGTAQAWDAVHTALRWNHADTIEEHRAEGYMLATAGFWAWNGGGSVGVWLEPANAPGTQVRAVVSRKLSTRVFGDPSRGAKAQRMLMNDIGKAIAIEKEGQPLPDADPD
jgi:hypothetical protein